MTWSGWRAKSLVRLFSLKTWKHSFEERYSNGTLERMIERASAPRLSRPRRRALIRTIRASRLFDEEWYAGQYPDIARTGVSPLVHFALVGAFEGKNPNPLFLTRWYVRANPTLAADEHPLLHFMERCRSEHAFPNPIFDAAYYLDRYSDVRSSTVNPLLHFIENGGAEGREINPQIDLLKYSHEAGLGRDAYQAACHLLDAVQRQPDSIGKALRENLDPVTESELFDTTHYRAQCPELEVVPLEPMHDYHVRGCRLNKNPAILFDTGYYIEANRDADLRHRDPFLHFLVSGVWERRSPHYFFDTYFYMARYPEASKDGLNPLRHFAINGHTGRYDPSEFFSSQWYLSSCLADGGDRNPLVDYLISGRSEGRRPHPDFDPIFYRSRYLAADDDGDAFEHFVRVGFDMNWRETSPGSTFTATTRRPAGSEFSARAGEFADRLGAISRPSDLTQNHLDALRSSLDRNRPSVSVVMPAWNRRASVGAAIRSVLAQDMPVAQLIVVDDGSDDGTPEYVREAFAGPMESGLLILLKRAHVGVCAARNAGLEAASGDIIAYLDSDNVWHPYYTLLALDAYRRSPNVEATHCAIDVHDRDRTGSRHLGERFDRKKLLRSNYIDLNAFTHRRDVYERLGGFDPRMTRLVDWELILRYTESQPPAFIPVSLVDYYLDRHSLKNISFTESYEKNHTHLTRKHHMDRIRHGDLPMAIGYVLPDWSRGTQKALDEELALLRSKRIDVKLYVHGADERSESTTGAGLVENVSSVAELAKTLRADRRALIHAPLGVPECFLEAARTVALPYTFAVGGAPFTPADGTSPEVLREAGNDPLCLAVIGATRGEGALWLKVGIAQSKVVIGRETSSLLAIWSGRRLDVVFLFSDRDGAYDEECAIEAIARVFRYGVLRNNVFAFVGGARAGLRERLASRFEGHSHFSLIAIDGTSSLGALKNLAIETGTGDYVVFMSARTPAAAQSGWDLEIVRAMDERPNAVMGGHLIASEMPREAGPGEPGSSRARWRSLDSHARSEIDRVESIDGSVQVVRRGALRNVGGFNALVADSEVDPECCHYLRGCGFELLGLPHIYSFAGAASAAASAAIDEEL